MTEIFEHVESALGTIVPAVPFALAPYQGSLPDLYIVHQLIDAPPAQFADDDATVQLYVVQVTIWSKTGLVNLPDVEAAMKTAGFQLRNKGRQLPKDPVSGHWGLAKEFNYKE